MKPRLSAIYPFAHGIPCASQLALTQWKDREYRTVMHALRLAWENALAVCTVPIFLSSELTDELLSKGYTLYQHHTSAAQFTSIRMVPEVGRTRPEQQ
jgi:hypothetical protein